MVWVWAFPLAAVCRTWYNNRKAVIIPGYAQRLAAFARQPPFDGQLYHAASRTWYNMRSANDKAVCSRHMAAAAAKQRTAHVTPQPKPALPVSLPLCGRQARMGLLLWYNNRKAVIIPGYAQRLAAFARQPPFDGQLYQIYGQGDARARPACAPMADYIMSAKRHCIVYMPVGPLLGRQCCDQGAMAWTQRAVIMYISCAVPTGRFILVGQRTLNGA